MIKLLLLLSLSFNIAHAAVIAIADDCTECHNNTLYDYVHETNVITDSDDLCTMHHLFHFAAIIDVSDINFDAFAYSEQPTQKSTFYSPPSKEAFIKPPIA
ncbi:hypothetical protein TSL1_19270 [Sulfurovum sp. TSL1]|nr:hypothetical protein TSL1_19270 [Sulfurovum sp. TSL1]GIU01571.1 hypothetical protein TSL6_20770 [Sulfurovum sp. TSL6]